MEKPRSTEETLHLFRPTVHAPKPSAGLRRRKLNDRAVVAWQDRSYCERMAVDVAQTGVAVPFLDLAPSHEPLKERLLVEIGELFDTGAFTNGPAVSVFEPAFAEYCGVDTASASRAASTRSASRLLAGGLEPGDEVIVPAATFVATLEAVTQAGGVPVVVDVSETDYCLDPAAAAAAIGTTNAGADAGAPLRPDGRHDRVAGHWRRSCG